MKLAALKQKKEAVQKEFQALYAAIEKQDKATDEQMAQVDTFAKDLANLDKLIANAEKFAVEAKDSVDDSSDKPTDKKPAVVEVIQDPKKRVYASAGHQLKDIVTMSRHGASAEEKEQAYNRLMAVEKYAASGLSSQKDPDGGYLIEPTIAGEIMQTDLAYDDILSRCKEVPLGAGSNRFVGYALDDSNNRSTATRLAGAQAYWANEGDTVAASKSKLRKIECGLHKQMAIGYATDENLEDAGQLNAIIPEQFRAAMDENSRESLYWGSGTEQPLGFMNSPALLTIAIEAGQTDKILFENVLKMNNSMPANLRNKAVWLGNQELLNYLPFMKLELGSTDHPVFMPAGGATGAQYDALFGRPILWTEQAAAPGTKGDLVFVCLDQYLRLRKGGVREDSSMHVRFLNDEQVFRAIRREGGMPLPNGPITPKRSSGGFKLGSFIALAAR